MALDKNGFSKKGCRNRQGTMIHRACDEQEWNLELAREI
jgi:hypothetical protein